MSIVVTPLPKAVIVGASVTVAFTVFVQLGAIAFGHGENAIGWFLMGPWFAILAPAFFVARFVGWHWQVGSVYDITLPVFIFMVFINALLGAFLGWGFRKIYRVFKRDA